jgi:hypothetical protein
VDLLFRHKDLDRAQRVLIDGGFSGPQSPLNLDIHWSVDLTITDLPYDMDELWERSAEEVIAGVPVRGLSSEDVLIHICVHLAFHHQYKFAGVRALADVREIVRHAGERLDWNSVLYRAGELGIENTVFLTLRLAHRLLDVALPGFMLEKLISLSPELSKGESWAMANIFSEPMTEGALSPFFWEIWRPGSFWRRIKAARRVLLPPKEFISQKYPVSHKSYKTPLYYLMRLKDRFGHYVPALIRVLFREEEMLRLIRQENANIIMRDWLAGKGFGKN